MPQVPELREAERSVRPQAAGKFVTLGGQKVVVRGVTYGTFAPHAGGPYPSPEEVAVDFHAMRLCHVNTVRVYTMPPRWLLDLAVEHGLLVMAGLEWEQHVAVLDDGRRARGIVDDARRQMAAVAGHPALLGVAVGNEIPASIVRWQGPGRTERFLERLCAAVLDEDPGVLTTYANYPSTEYLELPFLDLVSFNVFLETERAFGDYVARLHNLAGDRPLLISELGLDSAANGERRQARLLGEQVPAALAGGAAGVFVFSWTDDWHRGGGPVEDWRFGLTNRSRYAKPALKAVSRAFASAPSAGGSEWPRVSVVVCTHNGSATIDECLNGLIALDYPDVEAIVVDDGSTDDTADIVARYPSVRLIRTPNRGLSAARNTGIESATGEVIAFLDDDATPDVDWLRFAVPTLIDELHVGVGGPNVPPGRSTAAGTAVARAPGGPTHVLLSDRLAEHIPGCNMVFWKRALESVGGFDPIFRIAGDDVDICWRLQEHGWTLGFHPSAVVWHRRRPSVRAYLRQQREYGRAEALLERKWPMKYNRSGHLAWAGRVYASTTRPWLRRREIQYGSWGGGLFQSGAHRRPGAPALLPLMPEWYLLLVVFLALSLYDLVRDPLLFGIPASSLTVAPVLLGASVVALLAQGLRAAWVSARSLPLRDRPSLAITALIGALYVLQPLARLSGRLRHGLTPWRRRGVLRAAWPRPVTHETWSEQWASIHDWLAAVESRLEPECMRVRRGGASDRWDLHVRLGPLADARLRAAVEEHGSGRQLFRFRFWPRWSPGFLLLLGLLLTAVAAAVARRDLVSAGVLGALAASVTLRACEEGGAAIAAVKDAIDAVARQRAQPAPEVALERSYDPEPAPRLSLPLLLPESAPVLAIGIADLVPATVSEVLVTGASDA